ncbi:hypothetical protein BSNK01_20260 [Bacillaceae bacterium]
MKKSMSETLFIKRLAMKKILFLATLALISAAVAACAPTDRQNVLDENREQVKARLNADHIRQNDASLRLRQYEARRLEARINAIPGIEDAVVLYYLDNIIIGVKTKQPMTSIERKIMQRMHPDEARRRNVFITGDERTYKRIKKVNQKVQNDPQVLQRGAPSENVNWELLRLMNDIGRMVIPYRY